MRYRDPSGYGEDSANAAPPPHPTDAQLDAMSEDEFWAWARNYIDSLISPLGVTRGPEGVRTDSQSVRAQVDDYGKPGSRGPRAGGSGGAGSAAPRVVNISRTSSPEALTHLEETGQTGRVLTVDRAGATARRRANMQGIKTMTGMDRDESPPAVFRESAGAHVDLIRFPRPTIEGRGWDALYHGSWAMLDIATLGLVGNARALAAGAGDDGSHRRQHDPGVACPRGMIARKSC